MISSIPDYSGPPWKILNSLPDPVGFAGMAVGVSNGVLLAAGGSRFLEKPIWHGGIKTVSDRVFFLTDERSSWQELEQRLPFASAHAASTSYEDAVYLVGGINEQGAHAAALKLSFTRGSLVCEELASFPQPLAYGSAIVADGKLYVLGGVTDVSAMTSHPGLWALSLAARDASWECVAEFPGLAHFGISMGVLDAALLIFGGYHLSRSNEPARITNEAFHFDLKTLIWRSLPEMPEARVGAASPSPDLGEGKFLLAGGYSEIFEGAACDNPGFKPDTFIFDARAERWTEGPALPCMRHIDPNSTTSPGPEPMIAAGSTIWREFFVLVGGEVRPATRTTAVLALALESHQSRRMTS